MKIDTNVKAPEGGPKDKRSKEKLNEAFKPDEPAAEGGDEVGGRDMRYVGGEWIYPGYWHFGAYLWLCDGMVYRGWHWHPYRYSPGAWDEDAC